MPAKKSSDDFNPEHTRKRRKRAKQGKAKKSSDDFNPEHIYKLLMASIYEKPAPDGCVLKPDAAMQELFEIVTRAYPETGQREVKNFPPETYQLISRLDGWRLMREAHHHAVDLFYDKLRGRKSRAGSSPLNRLYCDFILGLEKQGLSLEEIASKVGLRTNTPDEIKTSVERVRHQLKVASKGTSSVPTTSRKKQKNKA